MTAPTVDDALEAIVKKSTYVTPHCAHGAHENTKRKAANGNNFQSCRGTYAYRYTTVRCTCWCHAMYAMVAPELSGALPVPDATMRHDAEGGSVDGTSPPGIVSQRDGIGAHAGDGLSFWRGAVGNAGLESQLRRFICMKVLGMNDVSDSMEQAGESGRRTRGSLDINVEAVCRLWLDKRLPFPNLTPSEIGSMINVLDPPSPGAIHAVLTRWVNAGLCVVETKPLRFVKFTEAVDSFGISGVRKRSKLEKSRHEKGFW